MLLHVDVELVHQFWHDQERTPAANLFGLENVPVDMITDIEDVFAHCTDHFGENVTRAARIDLAGLERTGMCADLQGTGFGVYLSQRCPFAEKQWLPADKKNN